MRKSATLLLLAALAGAACLSALGSDPALAVPLEPTDSGAPSAIIIFPVTQKPGTQPGGMPPVVFNHYIHEKWMGKAGKDCMVCHHTGDPVACTTCHTVEGKAEGGNITLEQAMHTVNIAKRAENTPSSCVSCHNAQILQRRNCAGCHTQLVRDARENEQWCAVCHRITPSMTSQQLQLGIAEKLPARQNEALAVETEKTRKEASYWSPLLSPYKVKIDTLADKYEPANFNHRQHVTVLMESIGDSELAAAFHTSPGTTCVTCHHNSPASLTPPNCVNCHTPKIEVDNPSRPKLMAAYHLQCMSCHKDMKVARPRDTDCQTCHKARPQTAAAN